MLAHLHSLASRPRQALLAITVLGVFLRIAYAAAISSPNLLNYNLDDFVSYRVAATDILAGDLAFTNSVYMKRPPLYSLLVAALQIQPVLVIAANILLGSAIIPLTFALAKRFCRSNRFALIAALIVALDAASIRQSANLRADALASLLLALAYLCLLRSAQEVDNTNSTVWALVSGGFIILSAFTRPSAYLLWVPMALWLVCCRGHGWGKFMPALALAIWPVLGISTWQQHNAIYFDNGSFSTAGTFQLLYVRAASVLYQATGQDIDLVYAELARRVESRLGNETEHITGAWRHRHLSSTSEMQDIMTQVATEIFYNYPLYYILTIPVGLYRALLAVNMFPVWLGPVWNTAFLACASVGLASLLRARNIAKAAFLTLPCLYFLAGTLMVATASFDTRARVMVTPLLAIMAAYGMMQWLKQTR